MRALSFFFLIIAAHQAYSQIMENPKNYLKLCDVCVCSEITDIDDSEVVLYIQCSEMDEIESAPDLEKIEWPKNPNGLMISATFEGLGISTIGKLPENMQVQTLRFSNNVIKTYWPDPFSGTPNLKTLSFSQNDLTEITADLFTNNENLETLDLSYNKLSEFNVVDLKSLRNVKRFNLQSNQLKKVPLQALLSMTALEDLDLSKNGIFDLLLHRGDEALSGLKRLNLNGNRIRSVMADTFPQNNSLELLDLSNNIIEMVEEEAFLSCTSLKELNLAQNKITLTFAMPPSLQLAILKINTMFHWPQFPSGISLVDLSYNRLDSFDENADFDHLEYLNIAGNQMKNINIQKRLPKLFSLDISYNLLTEIPETLNTQLLPNIQELRLDGNPISSVYFKNLLALKNLYMNELSNLEVVDEMSFSNVVGPVEDGDKEKSCFSLFLSNCPSLREIKEGAFRGTFLCGLDISNNNLTALSANLVDWPSIPEANLQFNPWHCSCGLQWLLDVYLTRMYVSNPRMLAELRCASPRALEGLRMVHFYNWTGSALCEEQEMQQHLMETLASTTTITTRANILRTPPTLILFLVAGIMVSIALIIGLTVYLVKSRRRYQVKQNALKRKRQSAIDSKNSNGAEKEQYSALNKV